MFLQKNKVPKLMIDFFKLELQTFTVTIVPILWFIITSFLLLNPFFWDQLDSISTKLYDFLKWNEWLFFFVLLILFVIATVVSGIVSQMIFKNSRVRLCFNVFVWVIIFALFFSLMIIHFHTLCYI